MIVTQPETFGQYRIARKLHGGGMGRVFLAFDPEHNRPVALKLIDMGSDPDSIEVLEAERRGSILQSRLAAVEPRVVSIYEFGEREGYFFLAMEYVEGRDLSELLAGGPLPIARAVDIAVELCEILERAHTLQTSIDGHHFHGIVHGDIKPRNIRLTTGPNGAQDYVKVLDFGIAKALSATRRFTQNQFGSVRYSSPERLNTGSVDRSSDLWALGVVLYEMLAGQPYFLSQDAAELERMIRSYSASKPMPAGLPPRLRQIVARALAPAPERRYASASELKDDLQNFEAHPDAPADVTKDLDTDATRRTAPPARPAAFDPAGTRRTTSPPPPPPLPNVKPAPAPPKAAAPAKGFASRRWLWRPMIQGVLVVLLLWSVGREWSAWQQAGALQHDLETERLTDLDQAWQRYEAISAKSHLPLLLYGLRHALTDRLSRQADQVISDYRDNDVPSVTSADWQRAQAALARALQVNPSDKTIRGKLRLCDGHIARINSAGHNAAKQLNEARMDFEEARDLLPKSPDPYLGLARLYIYGYKDVDRAEDALRQADRHGHPFHKREEVELGDGYRDRGDQFLREAAGMHGLSQEQDYLQRADQSYSKAQEYYQSAAPFAGVNANLRRVAQSRDRVRQLLEALGRSS